MSHKELLTKYIQHVTECEGVDFISKIGRAFTEVYFTRDEVRELERLRK